MPQAMLDLREASRRHMPALPIHPTELIGSAVSTWHARMVNEYMSSTVFESLGAQFRAARLGDDLADECAAFADEERRHGVLCGAVVEALGGNALAPVPERPPFPLHATEPPRAALLRNVIHICCMSETIAVALIGAERLEMPEGMLRDLITAIYSDEVGHARFGWRFIESLGADLTTEERTAVERYLPLAFAHVEAHELAHLPDRDALTEGEVLGLCSGRQARLLLTDAIERVIRPGLRRWFAC